MGKYEQNLPEQPSKRTVKLYNEGVMCGFPLPSADYVQENINVHELLVPNDVSCFIMRAVSISMIYAGILPGDYLIVDMSKKPCNHSIVVAVVDGGLCCKVYRSEKGRVWLESAEAKPICVTGWEGQIWGTVISSFRRVDRYLEPCVPIVHSHSAI